jgi:TPR repeat protein
VIVGKPGEIGAALFGREVGKAVAAGVDLANTKAQFNAQIATARRRFFAEYPNGKDFAQAEKEFAELLRGKDLYFMSMSLSTGFGDTSPNSMSSVLGKMDALTGGTMDNGIPNSARVMFGRWVHAIRGDLGAESYRAPLRRLPSANQVVAAIEANQDVYAKYKKDRDDAEFEAQCRARPGPYCAHPGGYSHGGATKRAARIADYYLAQYAQALPGGDATKAKVRDAIIKHESLAYTTQDCARRVDKMFENDPRHESNLAALRRAIAHYESAKVMTQEDICVRAAQDMQRDEARRNRTPSVEPQEKEHWDGIFRAAKFNELYGPMTKDQAHDLAQAVGGKAESWERGSTILDVYTRGTAARAAKVRAYFYFRKQVIEKAPGAPPAAFVPAKTEAAERRDSGAVPVASTPRAADTSLFDQALLARRERDPARARTLFEQACDGGDAKACFEVGHMFRMGGGGASDDMQARVFYEKACTGGDARGCFNLGFLFSAGIGGPQDSARAQALYEQACRAGEPSACSRLNTMQRRTKSRGGR